MTETRSARPPAWADELFAAIDAMDADRFASFLTEDAAFRFGNAETVVGRAAIRDAVAGFFSTIAGLEHAVKRYWSAPQSVACDGDVTYSRHDGSTITLPFADVFRIRDDRICEYLIYMDVAPLYDT